MTVRASAALVTFAFVPTHRAVPKLLHTASDPAFKDYLRCSTSWRTSPGLFFGHYPQPPHKFFLLVIHRRDMSCVWMVPHACTFMVPISLIGQHKQREEVDRLQCHRSCFLLTSFGSAVGCGADTAAKCSAGNREGGSLKCRRLLGKEHTGWQCEWPEMWGSERLRCVAERWGRTESLAWVRLWRMWRRSSVGNWQLRI